MIWKKSIISGVISSCGSNPSSLKLDDLVLIQAIQACPGNMQVLGRPDLYCDPSPYIHQQYLINLPLYIGLNSLMWLE
jgi:hypothetical protein